jgi:uncharacterized phage protein (TIGR02220 family)
MYPDYRAAFKALPGDDAKALIDALYEFSETGKSVELPPSAQMAFMFISEQIKRDQDKYKAKCEKNRENGTKGGRPKKENIDGKTSGFLNNHSENGKANGFCENRTEPKKANNKEKDIDIEKEKCIKSIKKDIVGLKPDVPPYQAIVNYLNEKAGTQFRVSSSATQRLIHARWVEDYTLDDFKAVIDTKCAQWKNDPKMSAYLRPKTLFAPSNFDGYLNEVRQTGAKENDFSFISERTEKENTEALEHIEDEEIDFTGVK